MLTNAAFERASHRHALRVERDARRFRPDPVRTGIVFTRAQIFAALMRGLR
jgi:hypothetical protein